MAYIVTDACIECKYKKCVQVCPVDAFREGPNSVVIDPNACISCNYCEPECPVKAIYPEDMLPEDKHEFIQLNADLSQIWPDATFDLGPMPEAEKWLDVPNKLPFLKKE